MQIIVALDMDSQERALAFANRCSPDLCILKVGLEAFTGFGPSFVNTLMEKGFRIFLDLKFHDIPNTVAKACKAAARLGVWMINVHALGGFEMMHAAREALDEFGERRPYLIAVTILTSLEASPEEVVSLAKLAKEAGLDGVVCSALEVPGVKAVCGDDFLAVTPGIRLPEDTTDDQKRVVTPARARELGSDYAVIGRSMTRAEDPMQVLRSIGNF